MKVLIVGGGGREHAIAWSLSKSPKVTEIFCAPGNGGLASIAKCVPIGVMAFEELADFAKENEIGITVVGMDEPLAGGIVDVFEQMGLKVFGPRKNAAVLEGSKIFSKSLMKKYGIPTAQYECFDNYDAAVEYVKTQKMPVVIKADGLALGKGVLICDNIDDAINGLSDLMIEKKFSDAGSKVVIEEFLTGPELSLLCFCDGVTIVPMVSAQDYKRALDNNGGLNTGGMGSISPSPFLTDEMMADIYKNICIPTVEAMLKEDREFKGVIYLGLIFTAEGIKVLEYNARFGDPETQVILPRLKTDLLDILLAVENGSLNEIEIEWNESAACCVVLASGGYPEEYKTGFPISGIEAAEESALVFHAGTKVENGRLLTAGGRVLGVTALGPDLESARKSAYKAAERISFENKHFRTDIGKK